MVERGEKKPILFEILLIIAAFLTAGLFTAVGSVFNMHPWITTAFFAVAHLTNLVGLAPLSVAIQLVYSFAIGLVLAAIYLKNGSITQVILVHFLIDFTSGIYVDAPTSTSWTLIGVFAVFIVAESAYAVWLTSKTDPPEKGHDYEEIC